MSIPEDARASLNNLCAQLDDCEACCDDLSESLPNDVSTEAFRLLAGLASQANRVSRRLAGLTGLAGTDET